MLVSIPVLVLALSAPLLQTFKIGSDGAAVELDGWEREQLDASLGPDQFRKKRFFREYYLVVLELDLILDTREDFVEILEANTAFEADRAIRFSVKDGIGHAIRTGSTKSNGLELAFEGHLFGADGRGYLLVFWTMKTNAERLADAAQEAVETFRFPGADSSWGQARVPRTHTTRVGGRRVEFTTIDSVFSDDPDVGDASFALSSGGEEFCFYLFENHVGGSIDDALDGTLSVLAEDLPKFAEMSREDRSVGSLHGRLSFGSQPGPGGISAFVLVTEAGRMPRIEARVVFIGEKHRYRRYVDMFLDSLAIEETGSDALLAEFLAGEGESMLEPGLRALLLQAEERVRLDEQISGGRLLEDGRLLLFTVNGVQLLEDGATRSLYRSVSWEMNRTALLDGDELLVTASAGGLVVREGVERRHTYGKAFARGGAQTWIVRAPERVDFPALRDLPPSGPERLFVRRKGKREPVAELIGEVTRIEVDASGTQAVYLASFWWESYGASHPYLLDLETGSSRELDDWQYVSSVIAAHEGFLVSGRPRGRRQGIWWWHLSGELELLAAGPNLIGLGTTPKELWFASPWSLTTGVQGSWSVHSIRLEQARRSGPESHPFDGSLIRRIAEETLTALDLSLHDGEALRSAADVQAFLEQADRVASELGRPPLPRTAAEVDGLLSIASVDELGAEGLVLAGLLLADVWMRAGATWIDGVRAETLPVTLDESWQEDPLVFALHPVEVVFSTVSPEGAWWQPATYMAETAAGREVWLSLDSEHLERRLAEHPDGRKARAALTARDLPALRELVAAAPSNEVLRLHLYRLLAAREAWQEVIELSETHQGDGGVAVDAVYWAAAALERGNVDGGTILGRLKQAVELHPQDARLFYLLGSAYEHTELDDRIERAAACYERAGEMQPWGPLAEDVQEALHELGY